jgi:hypothetical protein
MLEEKRQKRQQLKTNGQQYQIKNLFFKIKLLDQTTLICQIPKILSANHSRNIYYFLNLNIFYCSNKTNGIEIMMGNKEKKKNKKKLL